MAEEDEFWQALRRGDNEGVLAVFKAQKSGQAKLKLANSVGKRGLTPAHWACFNDNVELLKMLKHYDADVNSSTKKLIENWRTLPYLAKGTTPMHACAHSNSPGCAALLLEWEIDINAQTSEGHTAAFVAASHGHADVLRLVAESPLVKPQFELGNTATSDLSGWAKGATPLMAAASGRTGLNCVDILLSQFVNPNACDENGWTAVHYAAKNGCASVLARLVSAEAKADVNVATTVGTKGNRRSNGNESQRGFTPLHMCVKFCQYPRDQYRMCVPTLLKAGVDPNAVDDRGWSAAMWACSRADNDMLSALITGCTELTNEELDVHITSTQNVTITVPVKNLPAPAAVLGASAVSPNSLKRSDSLNGTPLSSSPIPGSPKHMSRDDSGSRQHSRHGSFSSVSPLGGFGGAGGNGPSLTGAGSMVASGSPSLSLLRGATSMGAGGSEPKVLVFPIGSSAYSICKAKQALACLELLIREKHRRRTVVLPSVDGVDKVGTPILTSPPMKGNSDHGSNSIQGTSGSGGGVLSSADMANEDENEDVTVTQGELMLDPVEQYIEDKIKLESERDEIKSQFDKLETCDIKQLTALKDEINALKNGKSKDKDKDKNKKLEKTQQELDAARAEIGKLRKQILDLTTLKTDMEEQIRDARNALAAKEEMWKKEMLAAHDQIALLQARQTGDSQQSSLQSLQATKAEVERQQSRVMSPGSENRRARSPPHDSTVLSDAAENGSRKAAGRRVQSGPPGAFERAASSTSQSLFDYLNDEKGAAGAGGGHASAVNATPARPRHRKGEGAVGNDAKTPLLKDKDKKRKSKRAPRDRNMTTYASDVEDDDDESADKKETKNPKDTEGSEAEGSKCCCSVM